MAKLRPMTEDEYPGFIEEMIPEHARENVESGRWNESEALDKARTGIKALFPQGINTPNQHLWILEEEGQRVGVAWFHTREDGPMKRGFIFQIIVDESFRGQGYGKQAMQLIEKEAHKMGLHQIGLNVFAGNKIARSLYEKTGYRMTSINMVKDI